jgi:hypothetical protein
MLQTSVTVHIIAQPTFCALVDRNYRTTLSEEGARPIVKLCS